MVALRVGAVSYERGSHERRAEFFYMVGRRAECLIFDGWAQGGKDLSETLTRAKFEELCIDLFKSTISPGSIPSSVQGYLETVSS